MIIGGSVEFIKSFGETLWPSVSNARVNTRAMSALISSLLFMSDLYLFMDRGKCAEYVLKPY